MQEVYLKQKRIYESPEPNDGLRVLVDRLWPRGVRKSDAHVDTWLKEIAPSSDLRQWFGHDPNRFSTFRDLYVTQLIEDEVHRTAVRKMISFVQAGPVTMLYAAKDPTCNHVIVLRDFIMERVFN